MVERRPVHESSQKRAREETNDEEESNNNSGRLVRRKGKKIMSTNLSPKMQIKPFKEIKIINLEDSDRSPSPSLVPFSPIRHGEEKMEEDMFVATSVEMQIGIPLLPPNLELDLTPLDIQVKAFRDARKKVCDKFLEDDTFVRSPAFLQSIWKMKIEEYKSKTTEKKAQSPDRSDQENQEEVKNETMEEFKEITTDEGRMIISQDGVLILPEWDIEDALAFDAIRKSKG